MIFDLNYIGVTPYLRVNSTILSEMAIDFLLNGINNVSKI